MVQMVQVNETGGPEVLKVIEQDVAAPGPGEIQIRQTAIGVNFIDVYFRTGLYPAPQFPFTPGMEGAGAIIEVADNVADFKGFKKHEINRRRQAAQRLLQGDSQDN